jgi:hypothetical protein
MAEKAICIYSSYYLPYILCRESLTLRIGCRCKPCIISEVKNFDTQLDVAASFLTIIPFQLNYYPHEGRNLGADKCQLEPHASPRFQERIYRRHEGLSACPDNISPATPASGRRWNCQVFNEQSAHPYGQVLDTELSNAPIISGAPSLQAANGECDRTIALSRIKFFSTNIANICQVQYGHPTRDLVPIVVRYES